MAMTAKSHEAATPVPSIGLSHPKGGYHRKGLYIHLQGKGGEYVYSEMPFVRNRVITMSAPRIAAQKSLNSQIQSLYRPMFLQSLHCILRTSRSVAAAGRCKRRYVSLITAYREYEQSGYVRDDGSHLCGCYSEQVDEIED